jgi:hypothetical protein
MREHWQRRLMALLWAIGLIRVFVDSDVLVAIALPALALYLILAIPVSGRLNLIVATLATTLAVIICALEGHWQALADGIVFSLIFTAFLPTLQLTRASLDVGPEVVQSRDLFAQMPDSQRSNAFIVGSNVLGSVLTLGTIAMMAPLLPQNAGPGMRRDVAHSVLRGLALSIPWSPFSVGMALALAHWPGVALWQVLGSGLLISLLGVLLSNLMSPRGGGLAGTLQALKGFRPLALPLGGTMLAVVVLSSLTPFGTIQTIIIAMPILCLFWVLSKNRHELLRVSRVTYQHLNRFGGELLLFCSAMTLGRVLQQSEFLTELLNQPAIAGLPTAVIIASIMVIGLLLALCGFHSVVLGACVMVLLTPFAGRIADIVAVQVLLYGWACGALLSLSALSMVVAANLFQVTIPRLIFGRNIWFMLIYGACLFILLNVFNLMVVN